MGLNGQTGLGKPWPTLQLISNSWAFLRIGPSKAFGEPPDFKIVSLLIPPRAAEPAAAGLAERQTRRQDQPAAEAERPVFASGQTVVRKAGRRQPPGRLMPPGLPRSANAHGRF
jgi:hypothetical protein